MSDKKYLVYVDDNECQVYNQELQEGIRFSSAFLGYVYFSNLFTMLKSSYGIEGEMSQKILDNKTQVNTIYQSLIHLGVIKNDIYERFEESMQQFDENQQKTISSMMDNLVLANHKMKLKAKSIQGIQAVNTNYWEEKYETLTILLEDGDWELLGFEYDKNGSYCELGHPIKKIIYIQDQITGSVLQFGVECINDVMNLDSESQTMLNGLFEGYVRVLTEYTFVLEQYLSNPDLYKMNELQYDAMKVLKPYVAKDKSNSVNEYKRLNHRREDREGQSDLNDTARLMTKQRYELIQYLLLNNIPVFPSLQRDLANYSLADCGLRAFSNHSRPLLAYQDEVSQYLYRLFLGASAPLVFDGGGTGKAIDNVNLIGAPLIKKTRELNYENYKSLTRWEGLNDDDFNYCVYKGLKPSLILNFVNKFLKELGNNYIPNDKFTTFKVVVNGVNGKFSTKEIMKYALKKISLTYEDNVTPIVMYPELKLNNDVNSWAKNAANSVLVQRGMSESYIRIFHETANLNQVLGLTGRDFYEKENFYFPMACNKDILTSAVLEHRGEMKLRNGDGTSIILNDLFPEIIRKQRNFIQSLMVFPDNSDKFVVCPEKDHNQEVFIKEVIIKGNLESFFEDQNVDLDSWCKVLYPTVVKYLKKTWNKPESNNEEKFVLESKSNESVSSGRGGTKANKIAKTKNWQQVDYNRNDYEISPIKTLEQAEKTSLFAYEDRTNVSNFILNDLNWQDSKTHKDSMKLLNKLTGYIVQHSLTDMPMEQFVYIYHSLVDFYGMKVNKSDARKLNFIINKVRVPEGREMTNKQWKWGGKDLIKLLFNYSSSHMN